MKKETIYIKLRSLIIWIRNLYKNFNKTLNSYFRKMILDEIKHILLYSTMNIWIKYEEKRNKKTKKPVSPIILNQ